MKNGKIISKSISLKQKNKKRNKESIKANNTRNYLLKLCDDELKIFKQSKILINSQTTEEYMENYFQNFTITLEIYNNNSHQNYSNEKNIPFKMIKQKYHSSFFDNKKLSIGEKKCKKFEKFLKMKCHTDDEPYFFYEDSLSNNSYSSNDEISFTKNYKKFLSKNSFEYLRNIFHSIHKEFHRKLISNEILDLLLNINLNSLKDKNKENYEKIEDKKFRPKSADLYSKRKQFKEKKKFISKDIFAIKLFRCLEE